MTANLCLLLQNRGCPDVTYNPSYLSLSSPWDVAWRSEQLCCKLIYFLQTGSYLKLQRHLKNSWYTSDRLEWRCCFVLLYFALFLWDQPMDLLSLFAFLWSSQSDKCSQKGGVCGVPSAALTATLGQVNAHKQSAGQRAWADLSRTTIFQEWGIMAFPFSPEDT